MKRIFLVILAVFIAIESCCCSLAASHLSDVSDNTESTEKNVRDDNEMEEISKIEEQIHYPVEPTAEIEVENSDTAERNNQPVADGSDRMIAYVPLDDRPDNVERVIYLAQSLGYNIVFPERDLYRTRLDGQPSNQNGTQYGDRGLLWEWVLEMDQQGCDIFILSLDQLLSGGLVNSRITEAKDICFSDGTEKTEEETLDSCLSALCADKDNRIYLFDSVMRLASTVGYLGYDEEEYTAIREYGKVGRPEIPDSALTLDTVIASYPYTVDGTTDARDAVPEYASILTTEVTEAYLASRARKLTLLTHSAEIASEYGNVYFIVGIDDSSSGNNIQSNECRYIEKLISGSGLLINGVDDLGMMMVAKVLIDETGQTICAFTEYFGGTEDQPTTIFDSQVLRDTISFHIEALGGTETETKSEADLEVLVLSAPKDSENTEDIMKTLCTRLAENEAGAIPTILIDASGNTYQNLQNYLCENVHLGSLIGYSGFCDLAIIAGAGISQGFARYAYLNSDFEKDTENDKAFLQSLTIGLMLAEYKTSTKSGIDSKVKEMGYSYQNILCTAEELQALNTLLNNSLTENSAYLLRNLSSSPVLSNSDGGTSGPYLVTISDFFFPWYRTFEVCYTVTVTEK